MKPKNLNIDLRDDLLIQWAAGFIENAQVLKLQSEEIKQILLFKTLMAIKNITYLPHLESYEYHATNQNQLFNMISSILKFRTEKVFVGQKTQYTSAYNHQIISEILAYIDLRNNWSLMNDYLSFSVSNKTLKKIYEEIEKNFHPEKVDALYSKFKISFQGKDEQITFDSVTKEKYDSFIQTVSSTIHSNSTQISVEKKESQIQILKNIYDQALNNSLKHPNARRYPNEKDVCLLFFLLGKKIYSMCEALLKFPSYSTMVNYKDKKMEELFGANKENPNLFDGSTQNVRSLIESLYQKDILPEQKNVVLAIDAASLRTNIAVNSDGTVTGLVEPMQISKEDARKLIQNKEEFKKFCFKNLDKATQAIFTVLLIPIDWKMTSFPICEIESTSGNATKSIVEKLESLKECVEQAGLTVIGYACDGDPQYLEIAKMFVENCIKEFIADYDKTIIENFSHIKSKVVFYDTLHLGKNNRYSYCDSVELCIWNHPDAERINKEDFINIGIPKELLDRSENQMDDNLALKLFTFDNIKTCIDKGKMSLAFALLPTSLLFKAVFGEATRKERIMYLSIGFALMFIYEKEAYDQKDENSYKQRSNHGKKPNDKNRLFSSSFVSKYLELTYNLIYQISLNIPLHLGALGSHILEHWYGLVRRLTYSDFSPQAFESITRKVILVKSLCKHIDYRIKINKRKSDSGCKLEKDKEDVILEPFGAYMAIAFEIINECNIPLLKREDYKKIYNQYEYSMEVKTINSLISKSQNEDNGAKKVGKKDSMSCRKLGIGVANTINPNVTFKVNSESIAKIAEMQPIDESKVPETPPIDEILVPKTSRVVKQKHIQSSPKSFRGVYGKKEIQSSK